MANIINESTPIVAVVIPCYREIDHVLPVIDAIGSEVSHIIVVDDACPLKTGEYVRKNSPDKRLVVIEHDVNTGVGGATMTGYSHAIDLGADIIVKLDGDGQMPPALIPNLIAPIAEGKADYTKGNRFHQLDALRQMPTIRIVGNLVLSFFSKLSSGYWNIFDTNNGFTAIHTKVARLLDFNSISKGFFFESDMLFRLNLLGAVVRDIPMAAIYGNENSHLRIRSIIYEFSVKHCANTVRRIFFTYFVKNFYVASLELVVGKILFLFGVIYGAFRWWQSVNTGIPATAGMVLMAALPIIVGSQLLIAFINFDTQNVPKKPLNRQL